MQALTDIMVMLCVRPAELKTLRIADEKVTGYVKNRNQEDLPRVFRSMEKSEERAKQLLSWVQNAISSRQLRDPGAVFAVVVHGAKNLSNAMTIAILEHIIKWQCKHSQTKVHHSRNATETSEFIGEIEVIKKSLIDKNIKLGKLSGQVSTLEKRLDKFHKRLAMLDEAVDKDAVVDIISDIINDVVLTVPKSSDGLEIHVKRSSPNKKVHPHNRWICGQSVQTSVPSPEQGSEELQLTGGQTVSALETAIQNNLGASFNNIPLVIRQIHPSSVNERRMQSQTLISEYFNGQPDTD
ncbi:hypothetical protein C1646_820820 [Rhizophagus diaphanus]|nr:hypothetical protein C1646_820820 [Rhizophagus diaphanus] [Rhizophagus sp. MUCL 43196]